MQKKQKIIGPSHELKAATELKELEAFTELPEIESARDYPELMWYEGYLRELEAKLKKHGKVCA